MSYQPPITQTFTLPKDAAASIRATLYRAADKYAEEYATSGYECDRDLLDKAIRDLNAFDIYGHTYTRLDFLQYYTTEIAASIVKSAP